jgi:hypothetical protein
MSLNKHYLRDQVQDDEMGGDSDDYGTENMSECRALMVKIESKRPLRRPGHREEDIIKMCNCSTPVSIIRFLHLKFLSD